MFVNNHLYSSLSILLILIVQYFNDNMNNKILKEFPQMMDIIKKREIGMERHPGDISLL